MNSDAPIIEDISKCCIQMLLREPFYAHFMMSIPKEVTTKIDAASILIWKKQILKFAVNPNFWSTLNSDQRYGLIKQEVLHLVFKHPLSQKNISDPQLYQLAAGLTVNQYLQAEQFPHSSPNFPQLLDLAKQYEIDFLPHQSVAYYYRQLDLLKTKITSSAIPNAHIPIKKSLVKFLEAEISHSYWKNYARWSASSKKIIEYQIDLLLQQSIQKLRHHDKPFGNLPKVLVQNLEKLSIKNSSKFNWKRILRLFATSSPKSYLKNTIRRPSKRYGTTPGFKIKQKQKILLAVDTSGSIQNQDLISFFREINHLWRQGTDLFLLECDYKIQKKYAYNGQPPQKIHGRGATNFTAAIKFANEQDHPDAIIYFTDGKGSAPNCLSRYPLLWVISANGIHENSRNWNALPGKKIKIRI